MEDHVIISYEKMGRMLQEAPRYFFQCHKGFLVNMQYIQRFRATDGGLFQWAEFREEPDFTDRTAAHGTQGVGAASKSDRCIPPACAKLSGAFGTARHPFCRLRGMEHFPVL